MTEAGTGQPLESRCFWETDALTSLLGTDPPGIGNRAQGLDPNESPAALLVIRGHGGKRAKP